MSNAIRPFSVDVPQAAIDDLDDRLRRAIWPNELPGVGDSYGVTNERVRELAAYWLEQLRLAGLRGAAQRLPAVRHRDRRRGHPLPARQVLAAGRHAADPHPRLARLDAWSTST